MLEKEKESFEGMKHELPFHQNRWRPSWHFLTNGPSRCYASSGTANRFYLNLYTANIIFEPPLSRARNSTSTAPMALKHTV